MLGFAFLWQSRLMRETATIEDTVHSRIDTALNRGRCGLWDWDLASGRVFWSHSMFDMLGLAPHNKLLGFGEISGLVHPDDVQLYELATPARRFQRLVDRPGLPHAPRATATGSGCARAANWCGRPTSRTRT